MLRAICVQNNSSFSTFVEELTENSSRVLIFGQLPCTKYIWQVGTKWAYLTLFYFNLAKSIYTARVLIAFCAQKRRLFYSFSEENPEKHLLRSHFWRISMHTIYVVRGKETGRPNFVILRSS